MRIIIATLALLLLGSATHAAKISHIKSKRSDDGDRFINDYYDLSDPTFFESSTVAVGTNDIAAITGARIIVRGSGGLTNLFDTSLNTTVESSGAFEVYYVSDLQIATFDPDKRSIYIAADSFLRLNKNNGDSVTWFGDGGWEYIESGQLFRKEPRTLDYREILGQDFSDYLGRTPEPTTLALLVGGCLVAVVRRKGR